MARQLEGKVISTKMDKTVIVEVHRLKTHPLYGKKYRLSRRYYVHDANNKAEIGQRVTIQETKPLSKHKRWRLVDSTRTEKSHG